MKVRAVLMAAALCVLAVACNVGDTFQINGNPAIVTGPGQFTEETQAHVDTPTITQTDRICAYTGLCIGWDRPKYHFWQLPVYWDWMGSYWVTTTGSWEMWATCDYYNPEAWCAPIVLSSVRG